MNLHPQFPDTGTWATVECGTESASTSPCWTPSPTGTDARAPSAPVLPPVPPPEDGLALPPAATPCWWRTRSLMRPPSVSGCLHLPGLRHLGGRNEETLRWLLLARHGEEVTLRNCRGAIWRVETSPLTHKVQPPAVNWASLRKPGRSPWNRWDGSFSSNIDPFYWYWQDNYKIVLSFFLNSSCPRGRWIKSRLQATARPAPCQRPSRPGESLFLWAWITSLCPLPWPGAEPEPVLTAPCSGKRKKNYF